MQLSRTKVHAWPGFQPSTWSTRRWTGRWADAEVSKVGVGDVRVGSAAVLVRGMSILCAHASSGVGGLIVTHSLLTPVQSQLVRVENCWRS